MSHALTGCRRALDALRTLWAQGEGHALRASDPETNRMPLQVYPTATAHALVAFDECRVEFGGLDPITRPSVEMSQFQDLAKLFTLSTHGQSGARQPRSLILVTALLRARLAAGVHVQQYLDDVCATLDAPDNEALWSPFLLFQAAASIAILERTHTVGSPLTRDRVHARLMQAVNRLMARRGIPGEPDFDPVSLAFTTRGLTHLDPQFRRTPFFTKCIEVIAGAQRDDGCWPDGVSISVGGTGDTIQQASVVIATTLGGCVLHSDILFEHEPAYAVVIEVVLAALHRTTAFLDATFRSGCGPTKSMTGWSSDRVRSPRIAETWITAYAARVYWRTWICERALQRCVILTRYGVGPFKPLTAKERERAWNGIVEPDAHAKPKAALETLARPILDATESGSNQVRPDKGKVTALLFGPPGSGKTYIVDCFACWIGWPLIRLNPGHFIVNGLEAIESTASTIFADLCKLDHAVVLFDECDELFRERASGKDEAESRSILSFATASMLPKLQELHDVRRVVVLICTNFLHRIDGAIRRSGRIDRVILFDRPDAVARRALLERVATEWKLGAVDAVHIERTHGWMAEEIVRLKALPTNGSDGSPEDCIEWWTNHGNAELAAVRASQFAPGAVAAIRERWNLGKS